MASLDSLPADQRAVLQLVLQRGRSYDDIADLLAIDRAAVRDRALNGLDALGPQTRVPPERRSLITDYLLGQLPGRVSEQVRDRLAESASERAWARVVASELAPLAGAKLPEIPSERVGAASSEPEPVPVGAPEAGRAEPEPAREPAKPARQARLPQSTPPVPADRGMAPPSAERPRPTSRRGGAALLALGALIAVVVVVVIVLTSGGNGKKPSTTSVGSRTTPTTATSRTSTSATNAQVVAQINLVAPTGASKTAGIAEVLRQGTTNGIAIVAQNVPANSKHDAYAVWLYNSGADSKLLGFVNPGVGTNGRLSTAGGLPSNANHFKQLIVTLETQANPKAPGKIVLEGTLTGL